MGDRLHAMAQHITGKGSLEECSINELQNILKRHPYFAPAQFLLLQKLKQSGSTEEAEKQYRKAVLYYHDPLLFEQFIASNKFYTQEWQNNEFEKEVQSSEQPLPIYEPIDAEVEQLEAEQSVEEIGIVEAEETGYHPETEIRETDNVITDNVPDADPSNTITDKHAETFQEKANETETFPGNETSYEEVAKKDQTPTTESDNREKQLEIQVPEQATASPANELAFEPYHTVDYFASQGIKVTADEQPKDKLGKQLKSFTEWLKTMKRLPAAQATQNVESAAEKKVETLADRSVSESDVVTEAMAEVWLKQGNTDKALDIYNKLSLLNPSKKAYFAAKIENLKQS